MASVTLATSEWISFFKEAGIPAGPAVNYAVMFVDNRIQKTMLMDLNKEIMNEMGITAVGDIIAILKHAKVVHRQDICKALTEPPAQTSIQTELRRSANSPATRMIANSLSRDSPPSTPVHRPEKSTSKISVTVSNKVALKNSQPALSPPVDDTTDVPLKRRRVTAEMEGTTRMSVFDRLGAESKMEVATAAKPTGVFSRLGDTNERLVEGDDDNNILQYAGVLKRTTIPLTRERLTPGITIKAKATSSEQKLSPITTIKKLAPKLAASAPAQLPTPKISLAQRLGTVKVNPEVEIKRKVPSAALARRLGKQQSVAQDSKVTSTKPPLGSFRVTIKRTVGNTRVTSSSDNSSAQMDNTGNVSVFKRLGRKSV